MRILRLETRLRGATRITLGGRCPNGFSLVELLTVIAIIAVVLAILVPTLAHARATANRTACQANLHAIANAWKMYLTDTNGAFYQWVNADTEYGGQSVPGPRVERPLNPYLDLPLHTDEARVFRCPSDRGGRSQNLVLPSAYEYFGNSYPANPMLIGQSLLRIPSGCLSCEQLFPAINQRLPGLRRNQVSASASQVVLVGDYGWWDEVLPSSPYRIDWHGRRAHYNLAFLDGHVEFVEVRKGLFTTPKYRTVPFKNLDDSIDAHQMEVPRD